MLPPCANSIPLAPSRAIAKSLEKPALGRPLRRELCFFKRVHFAPPCFVPADVFLPRHMTWFDITVLAVVQGIAEFLPVSSSGHLVILTRRWA